MGYIVALILAYILGTSNMAYYFSKARKVDFKNQGSKNLGASNAAMLLGWKAGMWVAIHDIVKGVLAVILAKFLFPDMPYIAFVAGTAAVMGHIFPFYLHFDGGKGFAPYIGMAMALNWKLAVLVMILALIAVLITDYMVAGTTTMILGVPVGTFLIMHSAIPFAILLVATAVVAYKHKDNYYRICKGTEIRFRSAGRDSLKK